MIDYRLPNTLDGTSSNPFMSVSDQIPQLNASFSNARVEDAFDQAWPMNNGTKDLPGSANNLLGNVDFDWDIGGLFMVPANWPMNLPSPCGYRASAAS